MQARRRLRNADRRRPPRVDVERFAAIQAAVGSINLRLVGSEPAGVNHGRTTVKNLALKAKRFLIAEDGPTAVEYAVMLALIVIVCLTAIRSIGTNANTTFESIATELSGS
jgi:pilus assembly protein Flp/PilA